LYVALAARFNWTEAQVDASDPDFLAELQLFMRAEHDHAQFAAGRK